MKINRLFKFLFLFLFSFNIIGNTYWYEISEIKKNIVLTVVSDLKSIIHIKNFDQYYQLNNSKEEDFFNKSNNLLKKGNDFYSNEILFAPQIIAMWIDNFDISWYYKIKQIDKLVKFDAKIIFNDMQKILFKWNIYLIVFWEKDKNSNFIKNIIKNNGWILKTEIINTIYWPKKIYFYTNADKLIISVNYKKDNAINIFLNNILWFKFNYYYFALFYILFISFWFFYYIKKKNYIKI